MLLDYSGESVSGEIDPEIRYGSIQKDFSTFEAEKSRLQAGKEGGLIPIQDPVH